MTPANLNQTSNSLNTLTRYAAAPEGTNPSLILRGKSISSVTPGAVTKKAEDGTLKYYTGDLVLAFPLPSCNVSQYLPLGTLTTEQGSSLDNILTQEQERKLRAKVVQQSLSFGDSFSFSNDLYNLASTFTPERRGDGLTADSIKGLFSSREWILAAANFYADNSISSAGAHKGESLISSVIRNTGATTPEVWKKLTERFATITESIITNTTNPASPEQLATCSNILTRLTNAAEGKQDAASSID